MRQASASASSVPKANFIASANSKANPTAFNSIGFDYTGFRTINSAAESP